MAFYEALIPESDQLYTHFGNIMQHAGQVLTYLRIFFIIVVEIRTYIENSLKIVICGKRVGRLAVGHEGLLMIIIL